MRMLRRAVCALLALVMLGSSALAMELRKGDKGMDALFLQYRLQKLGFDVGKPDGDYGNKTVKAVTAFQEQAGLESTGAVDEATWDALFDETIQLYVGVGQGFSIKTYKLRYNLPAPFTTMERQEGESGKSDHAVMEAADIPCDAFIVEYNSLDEFEEDIQGYYRNFFDNTVVGQYQGSNYQAGDPERFEINGKPASLAKSSFDFVNGGSLTRYNISGCVELDAFNGSQLYLVAMMSLNLPKGTDSTVDQDALIKAALAGARSDRDVLYEYQAGAAERIAAAGVDPRTPDFQPVDDGASVSDMVYAIQKYVDPAADGADGTLDGKTCVSLYYGAKLMKWYETMVANGNSPESVLQEGRMSLTVAAMDFDLMHAFPQVKEQYAAALNAARLALTDEAAPYLTSMGIETPGWTEAELDGMRDALMSVFDIIIDRLNEKDS